VTEIGLIEAVSFCVSRKKVENMRWNNRRNIFMCCMA